MKVAVVPVRGGELCVGGLEAIVEAGGVTLLIGSDVASAAAAAAAVAAIAPVAVEAASFAVGAWSAGLARVISQRFAEAQVVIVPASPDGRDLAPRLAAALGWPMVAGAVEVTEQTARVARWDGRVALEVSLTGPTVVTLQPGVMGEVTEPSRSNTDQPVLLSEAEVLEGLWPGSEATLVEVTPPDVTTMDLAEAPRIVGGGAGLSGEADFADLQRLATALDASMGATRVVTDAGWVSHERQIGTTGVVVDPRLYLAFGISGAVQHTAGLGAPEHIISVNTDPHCPMMAMADLAVVADAPAVVRELLARLSQETHVD